MTSMSRGRSRSATPVARWRPRSWRGATCQAIAGLLVCVVLVACGGKSDDATRKRVTIDLARATGRRARATAAGVVDRPAGVAVRVSAAPKQRVAVAWGLSCPRTDDGNDRGRGGTYATTPPDVRTVRLPRRTIAFCAVHAEARLSRSGRVKVTLLARER